MAGFLAKKLYNVPFVLTTHSLEPLRAWKAEQLGSGYAMSSWMERTAILDADAVIAVSNGTKDDILSSYPDISPDRIQVIYNGIDLEEYRQTKSTAALEKYGVNPKSPYILFVGRITRPKHRWFFAQGRLIHPKSPQKCAAKSRKPVRTIRTFSGSRRW
jgi:starch synthase